MTHQQILDKLNRHLSKSMEDDLRRLVFYGKKRAFVSYPALYFEISKQKNMAKLHILEEFLKLKK
jgi:hypothetical protein